MGSLAVAGQVQRDVRKPAALASLHDAVAQFGFQRAGELVDAEFDTRDLVVPSYAKLTEA